MYSANYISDQSSIPIISEPGRYVDQCLTVYGSNRVGQFAEDSKIFYDYQADDNTVRRLDISCNDGQLLPPPTQQVISQFSYTRTSSLCPDISYQKVCTTADLRDNFVNYMPGDTVSAKELNTPYRVGSDAQVFFYCKSGQKIYSVIRYTKYQCGLDSNGNYGLLKNGNAFDGVSDSTAYLQNLGSLNVLTLAQADTCDSKGVDLSKTYELNASREGSYHDKDSVSDKFSLSDLQASGKIILKGTNGPNAYFKAMGEVDLSQSFETHYTGRGYDFPGSCNQSLPLTVDISFIDAKTIRVISTAAESSCGFTKGAQFTKVLIHD